MKHKHYDTIIAYAEGKAIQMFDPRTGDWMDSPNPAFYDILKRAN